MPVLSTNYKPNILLRWGHSNTIFPYLFRKDIDLSYKRIRLTTFDQDFIDVDFIKKGSNHLVILCHGLEGSSQSQYIKHTASLIYAHGYDVACLNYRSCSGEMNKTATMYHSGFTADLHLLISSYSSEYDEISLVGFSLGGNMILKYLGDHVYTINTKIISAVSISAPCDLSNSSKIIGKWYNKHYEIRFLTTLMEKMKIKERQFPELIKVNDLQKAKSLVLFDEYFTAPLHGFTGAEDYYDKCNSLQFLHKINIPTLLINALDDPFLSPSCYPFDIAKRSKYLFFKAPKFGGHVGFTTFGALNYWNETEILNFIKEN